MKSYLLQLILVLSFSAHSQSKKEIVYAGTYSIRDSKGIYVFELNRANGSLKLIQTIDALESPTYLEVLPNGKFLYSVNRGALVKGESAGSASSFSIDQTSGKLTLINHVSSFGKDPCHISFDRNGKWAFVSNYSEGNFVVMPVFEDGSLGAPSDSKKYSGRSQNRLRQDQPYIHSAEVSPDNQFVYVSDLGNDKIYTYVIDTVNGKIEQSEKHETLVAPGSGPRHFTLTPDGSYAYSVQELSSTVALFEVDKANGALKLVRDTLKSLPPDATEVNTSADIHTDPSGKFLYVSNRGYDGISIYAIQSDGSLQLTGHQKTMGKTPRNFLVDKMGKYLWVANQDSDNITVFKINQKDGSLAYSHLQIAIPAPVCLKQLILK